MESSDTEICVDQVTGEIQALTTDNTRTTPIRRAKPNRHNRVVPARTGFALLFDRDPDGDVSVMEVKLPDIMELNQITVISVDADRLSALEQVQKLMDDRWGEERLDDD